MTPCMLDVFGELPIEIIQHIMSYNGSIKYRRGQWMNQLSSSRKQELLGLLNRIPIPYIYRGMGLNTFEVRIVFFTRPGRMLLLHVSRENDDDNIVYDVNRLPIVWLWNQFENTTCWIRK